MAEVSGYASNGIVEAEWVASTNQANTQLTITATQRSVATKEPVSGAGQRWVIQVLDDGDVQRSFNLWTLDIANNGPVTRAFRPKVLSQLEDLDIATTWTPPSSMRQKS